MTASTTSAASRNPWRIAAVALLPIMVLGLLLAALWNPQDRLDQVPAAIVNLDEPVEQDGQTVPLGRQLASGLVGGGETAEGSKAVVPDGDQVNFDWTITDADGAEAGLADGTYAAVVTIPEDFSSAATSFGGDDAADARQATIDVATPAGGKVADDALARVVAGTATDVMSSTLTETYVDNVLVGFSDLADGIGDAQDGATQLADGADDAAGGAGDLADGAGQLADGADDAAGGATELSGGASELADGAGSAASGASQLADGASGVSGGADQLADGASGLSDGAGQVADGARGLAGGIGQSAQGADKLGDTGDDLAPIADKVAEGNRAIATEVGKIDGAAPTSDDLQARLAATGAQVEESFTAAWTALGCGTDDTTDACRALAQLEGDVQENSDAITEVAQGLVGTREKLSTLAETTDGLATAAEGVSQGVRGVAGGNHDLAGGLRELQGGASQVATGADGVASGASELSGGADDLASGAGQVATGASDLSTGVGQLGTGADQLATGASQLSTGVGQLGTGAQGLSTGAGDLSDGVGQLAGGADDLSDGLGEAKDGIPTYSDDDRQTLASVVAQPVAGPSTDGLTTGASGPLFAVVALWLGALALLTVFPPVAARALGSTHGSLRLTLSAFGLPALVAAGTGAVVGGILAGVEGLSAGGWAGAIAVGALVSVAFVAVHQGFVGLLGNVGRGISLLVAVLIIATGVVSTVPAVLESLVGVLPVGAARDALTAVVVPSVGGLGGALAALVVWGLAGLALAVLVTGRSRRVPVRRLLPA